MKMTAYSERNSTGMTDAELESACEVQKLGLAPWIYWSSEVYSVGKCLRFWTKYPSFLPLFAYSDHGVGLSSHLFPHDLENQSKLHFTWHPLKKKRNQKLAHKEIVRIPHPWISYRHAHNIIRTANPRGTLVFFSHHVPGLKWEDNDTEEYFKQLRDLPEKFKPVVLCLHMHDIKAGHHKELRRHGFPIVTAGNSLSTDFVDHFYNLVKGYSYATSQIYGSQTAYCVELGIPYFFLGAAPKLINISHTQMLLGEVNQYWDKSHEEYVKIVEDLFRTPVDSVTEKQSAFIKLLLGLDAKLSRQQALRMLWREFFRNWRQWHKIPRYLLVALLYKLELIKILKDFRQKINKIKQKESH